MLTENPTVRRSPAVMIPKSSNDGRACGTLRAGGRWSNRRGRKHVRAADGESSAADEQTADEILNSGESSARRDGFEQRAAQGIRVRGLGIGDEECNRRRFTENELKKMVEEYFTSPAEKTPSASLDRQARRKYLRSTSRTPSITLTCKLCADSMEFIEDAAGSLAGRPPKHHRGMVQAPGAAKGVS